MKITTKYNIGDEVETLLGDIGHIIQITIQPERIRYTLWYDVDKYQELSERQIKKKKRK